MEHTFYEQSKSAVCMTEMIQRRAGRDASPSPGVQHDIYGVTEGTVCMTEMIQRRARRAVETATPSARARSDINRRGRACNMAQIASRYKEAFAMTSRMGQAGAAGSGQMPGRGMVTQVHPLILPSPIRGEEGKRRAAPPARAGLPAYSTVLMNGMIRDREGARTLFKPDCRLDARRPIGLPLANR